METGNKKLKKYLELFSKTADDWFAGNAYEMVKKYYDFNKNFFTKENLEKSEWKDFQEIKSHMHSLNNNKMAGAKAFGQRPNHPIPVYREEFIKLQDNSIPVEQRFDNFNIYGVGKSTLQELFGYLFPDECFIVNFRTKEALEFLDIVVGHQRGASKGQRYADYNAVLNTVKSEYEKVVKNRTDLPVSLEVDQFLSWVYATQMSEVKEEQNIEANTISTPPISAPLNQILYGPPGTGKTRNTIIEALKIIGKYSDKKQYEELLPIFNSVKYNSEDPDNDWQIDFITFHQNYSYEEFVEGISPNLNNDKSLSYQLKDGPLKRIVDAATDNPDRNYVLIIDEINRGNISKIFGELITLMEEDKRVGKEYAITLPLMYSQKNFGLPANLFIIGTMNTADKSIALVDIALRRRFSFIEMMPKPELIEENVFGVNLQTVFKTLNKKIMILLDRDHQIGHSYFMKIKSLKQLKNIWFNKILPLLNEYFYGDWEKLNLVLSGGFIESVQEDSLKDYIEESRTFKEESSMNDEQFIQEINNIAK